MAKVIKVIAFANGRRCPIAGQYLVRFDFDAHGGIGFGEFTKDIAKAKRFPDAGAVGEFWKTVSKVQPVREDGKPNRPLTSTTIQVVEVADG